MKTNKTRTKFLIAFCAIIVSINAHASDIGSYYNVVEGGVTNEYFFGTLDL